MKICKLSIRFQSLAVAAAILATPVSADGFLDRLYLDGEQGSMSSGSIRSTEFNSPRSRLTGQSDTANPYLGKVEHRVFDSGFSPQRDQTLFVERIQDGVSKFRSGGVTEYSNDYNMFKAITSYLRSADGYEDGGKPVIAMFTKSRQVFLIYRVYEARDGRATLLCYYNSDGRVGSPGRLFEEKTFTLNGYKLRNGYRITEGSANDRALEIGLIDPSRKLQAESPMDYISSGGLGAFEDTSPVVGQDDWETNPPHPDNYQYGEGQVETKAKSTGDLLSGIMEPVLFGAKIGMGAYMLKEMFKKDDDDDDEDEWGNGYGYGMGYGYDSGYGMGYGSGYGMQYGNGAIMGGGMMGGGMPGMYPGMYPGMSYPMNGMTYQQPYFPGSYPGTMPGGSYPGSAPMPGYDYSTQMPNHAWGLLSWFGPHARVRLHNPDARSLPGIHTLQRVWIQYRLSDNRVPYNRLPDHPIPNDESVHDLPHHWRIHQLRSFGNCSLFACRSDSNGNVQYGTPVSIQQHK